MSAGPRIAWQRLPLIEVATLQRGYDLPVHSRHVGHVPVFAANGPVGTHDVAKVQGPGVVTGRSGTIGRVHYADGGFWPLNTSLFVKDFHGNHPRWVYYLLKQMGLAKYHEGSGVPTLNRNNVHAIEVLVPSLPEQRRIAAILDHADALRAKRRQVLAHLDSLTQAIFHDIFGDPVHNPNGYPVRSLDAWVSEGRPITYGILKPGPNINDGVPYIRVADMKAGAVDIQSVRRTTAEISHAYRRSLLRSGDLLMSIRGHVGRFATIPPQLDGANITQDSARLSISDASKAAYVRAAMEASGLQRWMARRTKGVAVRGLNIGDLRQVPIPVPPYELQAAFASCVDRIAAQRSAVQRALAADDELFASFQSRAFAGEL